VSRLLCTLVCASAAAALALPLPAAQGAPPKRLYVSLGDSYASGAQVTARGLRNTRNGFAYQVPRLARGRGHRLELVNFGCGGATTSSLMNRRGCPRLALGPGGRRYDGRTQLRAAERFLRARRGRVALVTVSIGGNDITGCIRAADPVACVTTAVPRIRRRVERIAGRLRRAAGPRARIVGTTYPDVLLGLWAGGTEQERNLASLSVVAFRSLINPALKVGYEAGGARFVDVTAASGAYIPFERTTTFLPYGTVPVAVARACELTYFCAYRDIHLRTDGYNLIARLVVRELARRR
jgi:lysophospholipase L1-like esterase